MNDDPLGCLLVTVAVILAAIFTAWAFDLNNYFSDEITAYRLECSVPFNNKGQCDGDLTTVLKLTFRILDERQEIIYWHQAELDMAIGSINKFEDCMIIDRKNWQCKDWRMVDGIITTNIYRQIKHVSKFAWWKQKVEKWLK
jgi:hypothetical protein